MNEPKVIDLYEFLMESELQHYYNCIRNELKITTVPHLKYATDEDLKQIGLSRPEIRRMRKYFEKYYPHGYLSKIKRLLQNPIRKDELNLTTQQSSVIQSEQVTNNKSTTSPNRMPNNKHIISTDAICVNKQLGVGEFGIVQQGVWTNGTERIQVAIKCLCRERMLSNPMDFLKEAFIMHSIEHENIVRLYGVVLDTDSLMLVTELAPLRSLLECLKDSGLRVNFLTVPTLCEFAMQICNGMMYLENKRLIHRDLAARNVLVFSKNKVKISDFGLSKALGAGKDYYTIKFSPALKLPIAWCAPECINFLRFTSATDVWAFGVCLWEIFSYGFQPWAALTGQQILEAIDHPNCQRLEQPECCPKEYYVLMQKCWQHNPEKRPKFTEIYGLLPDSKPEQLKTIVSCNESRKDHLLYRQGEIITVLDRSTNSAYWKGVLNTGKTGFFDPANTVAHIDSLPSSNNRDSFIRTLDRTSKRKLKTEMISRPQNDLKHTGHVGLDGAYFGDVSFLSNPQNYNHLPRQIVTPYKPSEDLEQTPLLLPPSPDSIQTASGYFSESTNPSFVHTLESTSNTNTNIIDNTKHEGFGSAFNFQIPSPTIYSGSNPFVNTENNSFHHHPSDYEYFTAKNNFTTTLLEENPQKDTKINLKWPENLNDVPHEYHEISDDEIPAEKEFDLGPSLLDEMDFMFRSISENSTQSIPPQSPDFDHTNKRNEITELNSKLQRKNSGDPCSSGNSKSKKKTGTVKLISVKDEKILNHAIEIANEISARSMTDLVSDSSHTATQSPKRKFSFKFPNLSSSHNLGEKDTSNTSTLNYSKERKNFSEELRNAPDLQNTITGTQSSAYNSLVEKSSSSSSSSPATLSKIDFIKKTFDVGSNVIVMDDDEHHQHHHHHHKSSSLSLPRKKHNDNSIIRHSKDIEFMLPTKQAPRPTTLPYKLSTSSTVLSTSPPILTSNVSPTLSPDNDSSPLRRLRDKTFPILRPRLKQLPIITPSINNNNNNNNNNQSSTTPTLDNNNKVCESPGYLQNQEYTFETTADDQQNNCNVINNLYNIENNDTNNPIPLPPRDKKKLLITNPKRHIRKHPLIIPGSTLQRTLYKVTQQQQQQQQQSSPTDEIIVGKSIQVSNNNYNINTGKTMKQFKLKDIDVDDNNGNGDHHHHHNHHNHNHRNGLNDDCNTERNFYHQQFIENNFPNIKNHHHQQHQHQYRQYENLDILNQRQQQQQHHLMNDDASLHFESILENDICSGGGDICSNSNSPDVVDGGGGGGVSCSGNGGDFDFIDKNDFEKSKNKNLNNETILQTDNLNNNNHHHHYHHHNNNLIDKKNELIEKKKLEFSQRNPKYFQPKNELQNNVLFNKIKETVDVLTNDNNNDDLRKRNSLKQCHINENINLNEHVDERHDIHQDNVDVDDDDDDEDEDDEEFMVGNLLSSANDVSCEDLLEFSNDKPKGRERGVDSDEVRIMSKVLGKTVIQEQCLLALDIIDWDVHRAIKIYKLKDILSIMNLTMNDCAEALEKYDWDLQTTAIKLKKN